jgi:hypothetical protein
MMTAERVEARFWRMADVVRFSARRSETVYSQTIQSFPVFLVI